jgi:hypothetical protein
MVNAHNTCFHFQVADLRFLNNYVSLAKLRGVRKNCTVVMGDFQRNVINFRLLRIFYIKPIVLDSIVKVWDGLM